VAEDHLTFGHIPSLDECLVFAQKENVPLGLIVIGGVAMELYGLPRGTLDIDAEIACDPDFFEALLLHLKKKGIQFNLGDDVDHRGVIPLPAGYRDRATTVFEKGRTVVKILDPLDFVASKLRRGIEQDLKDALSVSHHFSLSVQSVRTHMEKIKFPLSEETFLFKNRLQLFLEELQMSAGPSMKGGEIERQGDPFQGT
jgi:hypothetical protein